MPCRKIWLGYSPSRVCSRAMAYCRFTLFSPRWVVGCVFPNFEWEIRKKNWEIPKGVTGQSFQCIVSSGWCGKAPNSFFTVGVHPGFPLSSVRLSFRYLRWAMSCEAGPRLKLLHDTASHGIRNGVKTLVLYDPVEGTTEANCDPVTSHISNSSNTYRGPIPVSSTRIERINNIHSVLWRITELRFNITAITSRDSSYKLRGLENSIHRIFSPATTERIMNLPSILGTPMKTSRPTNVRSS